MQIKKGSLTSFLFLLYKLLSDNYTLRYNVLFAKDKQELKSLLFSFVSKLFKYK